jgi:hypothetical protein
VNGLSERVWELGKEGDRQGEIGWGYDDTQRSHGPVGCRMSAARAAVASGTHGAPSTASSPPTRERITRCPAQRLCLALAAPRLATVADGVLLPAPMAARRRPGADPHHPARTALRRHWAAIRSPAPAVWTVTR